MKKILLLFLITTTFCFSQTEIEFKKGVKIINSYKSNNYKVPKSILFEISGDTHLINYYLDLTKKLKKQFKKKGIKVGFNYSLTSLNPFKDDLKNIPKKRKKKKNYEMICELSSSFTKIPESWKEYININKRKTQHFLNASITSKKNINTFKLKLDIHAYYTIVTQNKKISKVITNLITSPTLQPQIELQSK
ncbi:hypothetical protein LPB136_09530 [Tenacibaculum todarodis]|uniref:Uncharacterized protein n=1 Tax=Tenacibaculum todarodis TaxID=1850252 RepID=A0A1L3JKE2_9FLAO|nr:hypothetical protein [Tenacibaculum todarodis]APG65587.1 hypothetical protein LPB136_09530 [Tenacibaculum todarodis]